MKRAKHAGQLVMTTAEYQATASEADFQETLRGQALGFGLLFSHTRDSRGSDPGRLDCEFAVPHPDPMGRDPEIVWAELKIEGKEPTAEQNAWIRAKRSPLAAGAGAAATLRCVGW